MSSTMKKAPKKFAFKAKKSEEPTPLIPMHADWAGRFPDKSLAQRLGEYVYEDKVFETMGVAEDARTEDDLIPTLERWLVGRLNDGEREQLRIFAALVEWMDSDMKHSASAAQVVVPDCFLPVAAEFCKSTEALRVEFIGRVIDEPTDAPADAPSTTHQATEVVSAEAVMDVTGVANQATVKEPDATGQLPLVDEAKQPAKKITALSLESSDDVADVRTAMQIYADDLESQAKNLGKLNKHGEAASLRKTVARLKHKIDKQLSVQTAIAFNVNESIPKMVSRYVSGEIRGRAFAALMKSKAIKKGESAKDAEDRQRAKLDDLEALIGNIGEQAGAHVATLVVEAYERGKDQGLRERNATASQVVREAIEAAEAQRSE